MYRGEEVGPGLSVGTGSFSKPRPKPTYAPVGPGGDADRSLKPAESAIVRAIGKARNNNTTLAELCYRLENNLDRLLGSHPTPGDEEVNKNVVVGEVESLIDELYINANILDRLRVLVNRVEEL